MSTSIDSNDECESINLKTPSDVAANNKRPLIDTPFEDGAITSKSNENEKRFKFSDPCLFYKKSTSKNNILIEDAIRKWQQCTISKCIYENAVNAVLEAVPARTALNALCRHSNLEDEAVLTAIEFKGLRQPSSDCDCSVCPHNFNHFHGSKAQNSYVNVNSNNSYFDDENQEINFENSFLTTAVSVAIEEKGLSMYPM